MKSIAPAKALLAIALTAAATLTGCNSGQKSNTESTTNSTAARPPAENRQATPSRTAWPANRSGEGWTWANMAFPTGDARTSVIGVEKGTPREVRNGGAIEYTIAVTNLTGNNVDDVSVTEQVNNNFKFGKATPEAQMNAAGVMTWNLGDFKPFETKVIKITGTAAGDGTITSCSSVSYATVLCASVPVVTPQLKLVKTGPAEALKCDEIVYNFEVTNAGTGPINNVRITDTLPAGLMTSDSKQAIDIAVGTLTAGQAKKYSARVRADKAGKFDNKATASGDGLTIDSAVVSTVVRQPVLTVDLECPQNTLIGRELTYKATVKSTGDAASANTTLSITLPQGATFIRADNNGASSGGRATWTLGTLNPNDSRSVSFTVRSMNSGALQATATAQGTCAAAVTDSCSVSIQGVPDIGTSIADNDGVVLVGDNHVFTYTVKNQGQVDLTNVTVKTDLSAGLEFISSNAPTQAAVAGKSVSWNIGTVKPGQQVSFSITVKGTAAGEQGIETTTKTDQLQRTVKNDEQVTFIDR